MNAIALFYPVERPGERGSTTLAPRGAPLGAPRLFPRRLLASARSSPSFSTSSRSCDSRPLPTLAEVLDLGSRIPLEKHVVHWKHVAVKAKPVPLISAATWGRTGGETRRGLMYNAESISSLWATSSHPLRHTALYLPLHGCSASYAQA